MLEDEPTGQRGDTTAGIGRNGNEAVAFGRWLHNEQGPAAALPAPMRQHGRTAEASNHINQSINAFNSG